MATYTDRNIELQLHAALPLLAHIEITKREIQAKKIEGLDVMDDEHKLMCLQFELDEIKRGGL